MRNRQRIILNVFACLMLVNIACRAYEKIEVNNYHCVSETLYRSAQPDKRGMKYVERKGIKTIINLRNRLNDTKEIKGTDLKIVWIPMRASKVNYEDMVVSMKTFKDVQKPALVHCRRGSDRTGCFVACYRIVFENQTKEDAINELMDERYGYGVKLFPNILKFLENLDVNQFKKDVLG